jgi:hypothetical protein
MLTRHLADGSYRVPVGAWEAIMTMKPLVVGLGCALLLIGCTGAPAGDGAGSADKRLADLEKKVATLQDQNRDLRVKLRASHAFPTRSPIEDFFASPEFWQCTYDSSWSDCSSRCSKQTAERNKACLDKPEGPQRQQCVEQAAQDGSTCLKNCPVQTSPTDPPGC